MKKDEKTYQNPTPTKKRRFPRNGIKTLSDLKRGSKIPLDKVVLRITESTGSQREIDVQFADTLDALSPHEIMFWKRTRFSLLVQALETRLKFDQQTQRVIYTVDMGSDHGAEKPAFPISNEVEWSLAVLSM